jgi:hypothetical protein
MDVVTLRLRPGLLAPTASAAALAALLVWLGPPGADLAAHAYQRTVFLEHGFVLWNNFWYAGRYSFVTYSILYYPLAAALGIKLLAVLTVALAVGAFAVSVRQEWGREATWSIRGFAVVWALLVLSAAYPFMLGSAFALVAICFLQRRLLWPFTAFTVLTLAASPVAFLLLVVVLLGVALARGVERELLVAPNVPRPRQLSVLVAGVRRRRDVLPDRDRADVARPACTFAPLGVRGLLRSLHHRVRRLVTRG